MSIIKHLLATAALAAVITGGLYLNAQQPLKSHDPTLSSAPSSQDRRPTPRVVSALTDHADCQELSQRVVDLERKLVETAANAQQLAALAREVATLRTAVVSLEAIDAGSPPQGHQGHALGTDELAQLEHQQLAADEQDFRSRLDGSGWLDHVRGELQQRLKGTEDSAAIRPLRLALDGMECREQVCRISISAVDADTALETLLLNTDGLFSSARAHTDQWGDTVVFLSTDEASF